MYLYKIQEGRAKEDAVSNQTQNSAINPQTQNKVVSAGVSSHFLFLQIPITRKQVPMISSC